VSAPQTDPHAGEQPQGTLDGDTVVELIAAALAAGAALELVAAVLLPKLRGHGVTRDSLMLALRLTDHSGRGHVGSRPRPRRTPDPLGKADARHELLLRAAYVLKAAQRLAVSLGQGDTPRVALRRERPFWRRHEQARRARKDAVGRVRDAMGAADDPRRLGWYSHPDDRVTPECKAADGGWFDPLRPPLIGLPGTLHGGTCRCRPGPARLGALSVDQRTLHLFT
jgi:hypothetical protein